MIATTHATRFCWPISTFFVQTLVSIPPPFSNIDLVLRYVHIIVAAKFPQYVHDVGGLCELLCMSRSPAAENYIQKRHIRVAGALESNASATAQYGSLQGHCSVFERRESLLFNA